MGRQGHLFQCVLPREQHRNERGLQKVMQQKSPFRYPLLHHPVRQIGAHLPLLRGGVLLKVVGHGDVQQGIVLCLLLPALAGAEVGEGDDLAARRTFTRSLNWSSPPVASQRNSGKTAEQMTAVFSASTRARGAQGRGGAGALRTGAGTASNHRVVDAVL